MERKNDPLVGVKSWSDLTEEEQQNIRNNWEHKLPPEVFMYFMKDLEPDGDSDNPLEFTGNLYIGGHLSCYDCTIKGDLVVCGNVDSYELNVEGNFTARGCVYTGDSDIKITGDFNAIGGLKGCGDINVGGNFTALDNVDCYDIHASNDVILAGNVKCAEINVEGHVTIFGSVDCTWGISVSNGGNLSVKGNVGCDDIIVDGNFEVNGSLHCDDVEVFGTFTHGNTIKCHSLEVHCEVPEEND